MNLMDRPEIVPFRDAIDTWGSHVPKEMVEEQQRLANATHA